MPTFLNIIPYFSFARIYYHISRGWANDQWFSKISDLNNEIITNLIFLFIMPVIIFFFGIYFHNVIP